jgi:hypothetical protein
MQMRRISASYRTARWGIPQRDLPGFREAETNSVTQHRPSPPERPRGGRFADLFARSLVNLMALVTGTIFLVQGFEGGCWLR